MAAVGHAFASRYKAVRGLARGLDVLKVLNERPAGCWGIADLTLFLPKWR